MENQNEEDFPITLDIQDWTYLGEGNQHLVLKYNGDIPNFIGTVLRVRKTKDPLPDNIDEEENDMERALQEENLKWLVTSYLYLKDPVIGKMAKTESLDVLNREDFLEAIQEKIRPSRPEFRRHKSISAETPFELIFDYTFSLEKFNTDDHKYNSLTFEIKPKSSLFDPISFAEFKTIYENFVSKLKPEANKSALPQSPEQLESLYNEHFSKEKYDQLCKSDHKDRVRFTRYWKMQLKKQQSGRIKTFTEFDPHDFFQNEVETLDRALKTLMETPQNNLKVSLNTKETHIIENKEDFLDFMHDILVSKKTQNTDKKRFRNEEELYKGFRELIAKAINKSQIVETVQLYQDLYNKSSLQMAQVMQRMEKLVKEIPEGVISQETLKQIVEKVEKQKSPHEINIESASLEELIELLVRFLVSLAFRDCSVLVNLQFLPKQERADFDFVKMLEEKGFQDFGEDILDYKIMFTAGLVDFHMKNVRAAYTHPVSTKELFGLLLNHIHIENN